MREGDRLRAVAVRSADRAASPWPIRRRNRNLRPLTLLRPLRDGGCRPPRRRFRPGTRRRRKRGELRGGVTCAEQRAGEIRIHIRLLLCPCESEAREKGGWTPAIGGRGISLSAAGPSSHPCIPYNIQICLLKWLTEVTESGSAVGVGTAVQKAHVRVRNPAVFAAFPYRKVGEHFAGIDLSRAEENGEGRAGRSAGGEAYRPPFKGHLRHHPGRERGISASAEGDAAHPVGGFAHRLLHCPELSGRSAPGGGEGRSG